MDKSERKKFTVAVVTFSYVSMLGAAAWRMVRGKSAHPVLDNPSPAMKRWRSEERVEEAALLLSPPPLEEEPLESLSLSTSSDSPMDRLARRSAFEELEGLIQAGGGLADTRAPLPEGPEQPWDHTSESVKNLLRHQSLESERLTGWSLPQPARLPVPTFAPSVMAMGIVLFAMGLATSFYVCVVGAVIFTVAAWRWTGILQGEELSGGNRGD